MTRLNAFAVVLNDNGLPVLARCDTDASPGVAGSVLDQIPKDFRKVGPVEQNAQIIGDKAVEPHPRAVGSAR